MSSDGRSSVNSTLMTKPLSTPGSPARPKGDGDPGSADGPRARRFDDGMLVDNEILTDFVEHSYLDPTDDRVLDELLDREVAPGIKLGDLTDREQLRKKLLAQRAAAASPAPSSAISPTASSCAKSSSPSEPPQPRRPLSRYLFHLSVNANRPKTVSTTELRRSPTGS
jgi:DNA repair protein RadD